MKRVLVTGAAGLIGNAVVAHLASVGIAVTSLILEPADVPCDRLVVGDATDPAVVSSALRDADCVVIATHHAAYDWAWVARHARVIVDTRNVLAGIATDARVVTL